MQMAPPALIAVVAFLCCAPGMHTLSRQCCGALCRAGIAPPLVGLLASEADGARCTEVGSHAILTATKTMCCAADWLCHYSCPYEEREGHHVRHPKPDTYPAH